LDLPATMCWRISSSRGVRPVSRSPLRFPARVICGSRTVFALCNFLDGSDEVEIHRVFQDVAAGTGFERLADERVFGMHAQHEDGDVGKFGENAAGSFDAVDLRKGAIHDDDGGVELLGELNGLEAVTGFAYDVERRFVFEDAAKTAADEGVVVNEEDGQFSRHEVPPVREGHADERGYHLRGAGKLLASLREFRRVRAWRRGRCRFALPQDENLCRDLRLPESGLRAQNVGESRLPLRRNDERHC